MIKLIASDVDGTLLQNGALSLEPRVFTLIHALQERGIVFAAASGRQYLNLRHLFAPVCEEILFVAENGALVMQGDTCLHKTPLPFALTQELKQDLLAIPQSSPVLCGRYTCYIQPAWQPFMDYLLYELRNTVTVVEDLMDVREDLFKVSLYTYSKVTDVADFFLEKWSPYFDVAVSGEHWLDFTLANKGAALRMLQDHLGLKREEMMAFGDNFNDEYMFRQVGHPYAMASARPEIRAMCPNICDRVEDVLEQVLQQQ